jgi:hypothetical protein
VAHLPRALGYTWSLPTTHLRSAVERFLAASREPILQEPGEESIPLTTGHYALEDRNGHLQIQAWDERRNIVRRIVGIDAERPGRLELRVERFARRIGTLLLADMARAKNQPVERHGERLIFREQFRRLLLRQFTSWKVAGLSTEMDLHHSLSPNYPRALLKKGASGWAAIGASEDPDHALSFGLIWLDHLRRREPKLTIAGLAIFLPREHVTTTCLRLKHLSTAAAQYLVFAYSPEGYSDAVDIADSGNLQTRLETCRCPSAESQVRNNVLIERACGLPEVEAVERGEGTMSLRIRGMEFARVAGGELEFGLESRRPACASNWGELETLVRELSRMRSSRAADRTSPLYRNNPEAWLESQVRSNPQVVDAQLLPSPIYGQVPAFAGGDRGVLDLLAVDHTGRLAVMEIKASQDLHLPLQALDYWMRVSWHALRGEFSPLGYFPGVPLRRVPPRLLLVAPALAFHPSTETILRFFTSDIAVERIGVGVEWQKELLVLFRLHGAEGPR